jgi:hypothetical protein
MTAAKVAMLNGREPVTNEDYQRIMNFIAANVIPNAMLSACQLMRVIYEMPITEKQVIEIVEFQLAERKAKEL